jgi:hypothetical protein
VIDNGNPRLATEDRNNEDDEDARKGLLDPSVVRRFSGSRFHTFLSQSYSHSPGGVHIHPNNSGIGLGTEGGEEEEDSEEFEDVWNAVSEDLFEANHWAEEAWERARSRKEEKRREKAASAAAAAAAAASASTVNNASKAMKGGGKGGMGVQSKLPQSRFDVLAMLDDD